MITESYALKVKAMYYSLKTFHGWIVMTSRMITQFYLLLLKMV